MRKYTTALYEELYTRHHKVEIKTPKDVIHITVTAHKLSSEAITARVIETKVSCCASEIVLRENTKTMVGATPSLDADAIEWAVGEQREQLLYWVSLAGLAEHAQRLAKWLAQLKGADPEAERERAILATVGPEDEVVRDEQGRITCVTRPI